MAWHACRAGAFPRAWRFRTPRAHTDRNRNTLGIEGLAMARGRGLVLRPVAARLPDVDCSGHAHGPQGLAVPGSWTCPGRGPQGEQLPGHDLRARLGPMLEAVGGRFPGQTREIISARHAGGSRDGTQVEVPKKSPLQLRGHRQPGDEACRFYPEDGRFGPELA